MSWKSIGFSGLALVLLAGCVAASNAKTSDATRASEPPQNDVGARTGGARGPSTQSTTKDAQ